MAVIRDVMPAFELAQPNSIADAQKLLEQQGENGWVLAGGMDSFDWLKDRIKKPKVVVDLSGIAELKGVRTTADGIEIGAMTTLTEVVQHPVIREKYKLLAESAELVASPQIRNQGTIGGNVSQDARCWYYRAGWPCYRAGGNICYADTPEGRNREHAILHADRCVAVNPSDSAPALIALDAKFVIRTSKGERVVDAEDYFIGPDIDITRLHILQPGDLLTAIRIPSTWAGAHFYFEKVRDRNVWDFPLLNVASAMVVSGGSDRANPHRGKRRRRSSSALEGCRRRGPRQAAECSDGRDGGKTGGAGRRSAAIQRLQDSADEKPGEARHRRRGGGNMGFLEWATRSVGANCSHPHCVVLDMGCGDGGIAFLIVHAIYLRYFAKPKQFAPMLSPDCRAQSSQARSPALAGGARCFTGSWQPPCSRCCSPLSSKSGCPV